MFFFFSAEVFAILRLSWASYTQNQSKNSPGSTHVTEISKIRKIARKLHVFFSASALKDYSATFFKNCLPTFKKAAPTQLCQVK